MPPTRSWGSARAVLATTTGVAVSTIHLAQPLLTDVTRQLGTSTARASTIATAVQLGCAAGILLLTWAGQVLRSAHRSRVLAANHDADAQANATFTTLVFLGGSRGAALGPTALRRGDMPAVAVLGVVPVAVDWGAAADRVPGRGGSRRRRDVPPGGLRCAVHPADPGE